MVTVVADDVGDGKLKLMFQFCHIIIMRRYCCRLNYLTTYTQYFSSPIIVAAVDIESIVSQCCNEGNEWGSQRKHCNEYKFNLDKNVVPAGLHGLCLSTVEICCAKQHRIYQCTGE